MTELKMDMYAYSTTPTTMAGIQEMDEGAGVDTTDSIKAGTRLGSKVFIVLEG